MGVLGFSEFLTTRGAGSPTLKDSVLIVVRSTRTVALHPPYITFKIIDIHT